MTRTSYTLHTLAKGLKALETLEAAGYVQQDAATKRYTLGLRLWEMGARVAGRTGLVEATRPDADFTKADAAAARGAGR